MENQVKWMAIYLVDPLYYTRLSTRMTHVCCILIYVKIYFILKRCINNIVVHFHQTTYSYSYR